MNLGTILVIIAVILAVVDAALYHPAATRRVHWLLTVAVILGFVGVLLGAAPLTLK